MTTIPLRHLAEVRSSSVDKKAHDGEFPVRLCNYMDVYRNDRVNPGLNLMAATATPDEVDRFRLVVGDSVITKDSEDPSDIGISAFVDSTAQDFVCGYHLAILRPGAALHPRFLNWAIRGREILGHWSSHATGMTRYGLGLDGIKSAPVRALHLEDQRRIADFLDDRVDRIDRIIAARRAQMLAVTERRARASYDVVRGASIVGARRESGLGWLGTIPETWPMLTVNTEFSIELGKMLDEGRQTGQHAVPYLRNINVQWDVVDVSDLKRMDVLERERERFGLRRGDLLICEGGQPGRAAMWDGRVDEIAYQKALHRARSRGRSHSRWLLECLRVAVGLNAFAAENGQTTIGHLTKEQLRAQRFPFPDPGVQETLLRDLVERAQRDGYATAGLHKSIDLLSEYKSALITAAVTGELDVTTAGSGIPA